MLPAASEGEATLSLLAEPVPLENPHVGRVSASQPREEVLDPDDDHLHRDRGQDHSHEASHNGAHRLGHTSTDAG